MILLWRSAKQPEAVKNKLLALWYHYVSDSPEKPIFVCFSLKCFMSPCILSPLIFRARREGGEKLHSDCIAQILCCSMLECFFCSPLSHLWNLYRLFGYLLLRCLSEHGLCTGQSLQTDFAAENVCECNRRKNYLKRARGLNSGCSQEQDPSSSCHAGWGRAVSRSRWPLALRSGWKVGFLQRGRRFRGVSPAEQRQRGQSVPGEGSSRCCLPRLPWVCSARAPGQPALPSPLPGSLFASLPPREKNAVPPLLALPRLFKEARGDSRGEWPAGCGVSPAALSPAPRPRQSAGAAGARSAPGERPDSGRQTPSEPASYKPAGWLPGQRRTGDRDRFSCNRYLAQP